MAILDICILNNLEFTEFCVHLYFYSGLHFTNVHICSYFGFLRSFVSAFGHNL